MATKHGPVVETGLRSAFLRVVLGCALAGFSTGLLTVAFPPFGLWPVVFVALVPMLLAQHFVLPRRLSSVAPALAVGTWLGLYLAPGLEHLSRFFRPGFGAPIVRLAMVSGIALLIFLLELPSRRLHERTGYRWFMVSGSLVWVGQEMVRSLVPGVGTAGFLAYALAGEPWLIQPVRVLGIFGLGLLIALVN